MPAISLDSHIEATPGVCGGRPRITGRRIRVQDIAAWHLTEDWSAARLAEELKLTLSEVHAALAYYYDHLDEIEADMRRDLEIEEESKLRYPSMISESARDAFRKSDGQQL